MNEKKPKPNLPVIKCDSGDIDYILKLCAATTVLDQVLTDPDFKRRLDAIPHASTGVKMMYGRMFQLVMDLVGTIPEPKRDTVIRLGNNMKFRVYHGRPASVDPKRETLLLTDDLNCLCNYAKMNCDMCFDGNCNSCKLGKTFDRVMPYSRDRHERWSTWEGWPDIP